VVGPPATSDEAADANHDDDVHEGDECTQGAVDQRPADHHVDVVETVLQDRNGYCGRYSQREGADEYECPEGGQYRRNSD